MSKTDSIEKLHHPCQTWNCHCPLTFRRISPTTLRPYEVQIDKYKCGPIAIINALHYCARDAGPALRRSLLTTCQTVPEHSDGFKGTKPDRLDIAISHVLSSSVRRFIGRSDCIRAIRNNKFKAYIILYSGFRKNKEQYFHYIFTYKSSINAASSNSDNSPIFISQNDGSYFETRLHLADLIAEYFNVENTHPISYPQVWAII
jgi:hypothetical protein